MVNYSSNGLVCSAIFDSTRIDFLDCTLALLVGYFRSVYNLHNGTKLVSATDNTTVTNNIMSAEM